jgi:hypothetical protein
MLTDCLGGTVHSQRPGATLVISIIVTSIGCATTHYSATTPRNLTYQIVTDRLVDSGGLGALAIDEPTRLLYGVGGKIIDVDRDSIVGSWRADVGHGYAFADELGRGVSRRGTIFDLRTRDVLHAGYPRSAPAVAYDRVTQRAAVDFDTTAVLDVVSKRIVGKIVLGPSGSIVADGRGHFIVDLSADTLVELDARRLTVTHRWPLSPCESPAGMAIDQSSRRAFVSCRNDQLVVVDMPSGRVVANVAIHPAAELAYDQSARLLFVPTAHDTLGIVAQTGRDTYTMSMALPVGRIAPVAAVDKRSHTVFLVHFGASPVTQHAVYLMSLRPSGSVGMRTVPQN